MYLDCPVFLFFAFPQLLAQHQGLPCKSRKSSFTWSLDSHPATFVMVSRYLKKSRGFFISPKAKKEERRGHINRLEDVVQIYPCL